MNTSASTVNLLDNPAFKAFLEAFQNIVTQQVPLDHMRQLSTDFFLPPDTELESVEHIENLTCPGRDGNQIPLRIYIPNQSKKMPTLIYFHRGGWVFGNNRESEPICRKLANHLNCIVIAVDYRLAPENPFPKPLNDCYDATEWIAKHIDEYGGDKKNLIVFGESAGGNLAAAVAMMARDNKSIHLAAQVLVYPIITSTIKDASYDNCVDQYFLTKDSMRFFWKAYLQDSGEANNPYASPDLAMDLNEMAPALIITAEYDALHAEADAYADSLREAGTRTISKCMPEVIHGFLDLPFYSDEQKAVWLKEIGVLLGKLMSPR